MPPWCHTARDTLDIHGLPMRALLLVAGIWYTFDSGHISFQMFLFASRLKLEFYVDCLGQFLSMIIWLGWQATIVALVGQVEIV